MAPKKSKEFLVYLPIYVCDVCTIVEKGIPWSPIEHFVLFGISQSKCITLEEICVQTNLPLPVVSESVVRFSQFKWIKLEFKGPITNVSITEMGRYALNNSELPFNSRRNEKRVQFGVERLAGTLVNISKARIFEDREVKKLISKNESKLLPARYGFKGNLDEGPPEFIEQKLIANNDFFNHDETFVAWKFPCSILDGKYIAVYVEDYEITRPEGLDNSIKPEILNHIRNTNVKPNKNNLRQQLRHFDRPSEWKQRKLKPSDYQLVIGGKSHLNALEQALTRAKSHVIIYSTFIRNTSEGGKRPDFGGIERLIERCVAPAAAGVEIDILCDFDINNKQHRLALKGFFQQIENAKVGNRIRLHDEAVQSHAKFLFYDDSNDGPTMIIGSCNWCYTNFMPLEVSALFNKNELVRDSLELFLNLLPTTEKTIECKHKIRKWMLSARYSPVPTVKNEVLAKILVAGQFIEAFHLAIKRTNSRIVIVSNRIGLAVENQIIEPLLVAVNNKSISATLYFQSVKENQYFQSEDVVALKRRVDSKIKIVEMKRSTHAKFICWDNDEAIISSLNFLSKADDHREPYSEVGIHVSDKNISDLLLQKLKEHLSK